jgi:hypothetical protein
LKEQEKMNNQIKDLSEQLQESKKEIISFKMKLLILKKRANFFLRKKKYYKIKLKL